MSQLIMYPPLPEPANLLSRYRQLSPTAAIKISPLILGSMSFGEAWRIMGAFASKERVFEILDFYHSKGGNAIDTGNIYQEEEAEKWIGEWMEARGTRDEMVVMTKYTMMHRRNSGKEVPGTFIPANYQGNGKKSLVTSVESSLKKLRTSYIDVLYVHHWDYTTSIPELMQSLHNLVQNGKVLYLGISNTPAWIVSKANEYARNNNLTQFSVYSGLWNAARRDIERDLVPMALSEGMAIVPWGALAEGKFAAYVRQLADTATNGEGRAAMLTILDDKDRAVAAALHKVATAHDVSIFNVAIAYLLHKSPYVFPVIGVRSIEQLLGNISALSLPLSKEEIESINNAANFDIGYPHNWLGGPKGAFRPEDVVQSRNQVFVDYVEAPKPIKAIPAPVQTKSPNGNGEKAKEAPSVEASLAEVPVQAA